MWIPILKPGPIDRDGMILNIDVAALAQAVGRFERSLKPLILDFDFQSQLVAPSELPSVTLGTFTALAVIDRERLVAFGTRRPDVPQPQLKGAARGLWGWVASADVTPLGRELIDTGHYRYTRAAFDAECFDRHGNAVEFELACVAATNMAGSVNRLAFSKLIQPRLGSSLVTTSTGGELPARSKEQMSTKGKMSSGNAEFTKLVETRVQQGKTFAEAMDEVARERPELYSTPSNVGARRFDNQPAAKPTIQTHEWKARAQASDPVREKRDAIFTVAGRLFPQLSTDQKCRIADVGAGLARQRYDEMIAKTPNLPLQPPQLSRPDQARLNACLRNLDADLVDTYADKGPLE